jgi:Flp pilus assembly protein TadG
MRVADIPDDRAGRARRGAAAVELAVVLPLLIVLVLGCVDFGRFASSYIAVTNAARAGAGYGIMNNYTSSTLTTWQSGIVSAARAEGFLGTNVSVATPVVVLDATTGLRKLQVTASYTFNPIVPWPGIPSTLSMSRMVELRMIR